MNKAISFITFTTLASCLCLPATAAEVSQLQITGGYWYIQNDAPSTSSMLVPGPNAVINMPAAPPVGSVDAPVVTGEWFNSPLYAYISGSTPIKAEIKGSLITIDLSGWEKWWNGISNTSGGMAIGSANATGTPGLYNFSANWSAVDVGGVTNGLSNYWTLNGYAQLVPEPSQMTLLLTGLGLVGWIARQRKQSC